MKCERVKTRDLWHEFFYICVEKPLLVLNDCLSYVPNTYTISYIAAQSQARIGRKMKLKSDVKKIHFSFLTLGTFGLLILNSE